MPNPNSTSLSPRTHLCFISITSLDAIALNLSQGLYPAAILPQNSCQDSWTFLKDTKQTLQVIQDINDKVRDGTLSLDGVAVVSLDVENMHKITSEELGSGSCRHYLQSETFLEDGSLNSVSGESIISALNLCLNISVSIIRFISRKVEWEQG